MTDAQAQKFVAALDKIDVALMAIRMEFEEQVRISNERLAELRAKGTCPQFSGDVRTPPAHAGLIFATTSCRCDRRRTA